MRRGRGYCLIPTSPLKAATGEINGIIGLVRDETSLKKSIQEKEDLKRQLQRAQKMEAMGTLAGGIAHDFNNILFPVIGNAEMLLQDIDKKSTMYKPLNEMLMGMQTAKDLIKQILSFSRQADFESKPIQIQPIIRKAVTLLRSSLPSTISINQYLKQDCGPVFTNESHVHQLVMNLCTNAFHAMSENGGVLTVRLKQVTISSREAVKMEVSPGKFCLLTVEDTGDGIKPEVLPHIFNPYFTTKKDGQGTGLGLSVSHGIVIQNKGHIAVDSTVGQGTLFTVYLPICEEKVAARCRKRLRWLPFKREMNTFY
jgi:signal transduction histidine kinase